MSNAVKAPQTLLEAVVFFSDEKRAFDTVVSHRWPNGVACPLCGCVGPRYIETKSRNKSGNETTRRLWQCNDCRKQFTAKTGSIFEDSPLPFSKWLPAMWLLANCKNGISSYELARDLKVTQKSAWFMLQRLRLSMQNESLEMLVDDVEADETFIGGKARNMHKAERERKITGTGGKDKTVVAGLLERGGKVRAQVVEDRTSATLTKFVKDNALAGCNLYTDALNSYYDLGDSFQHQVVDHAIAYVDGRIHTNGLENFWSLFKRGLNGTYISVEPFHLFRYLDEQTFRFNERKGTDADRFTLALTQTTGRRLTYAKLTGKELAAGA